MRTPKLDWEALKPLMLNLRQDRRLTLSQINEYLFENYGKCVTNARLCQVYKAWKDHSEAVKINEGAGI